MDYVKELRKVVGHRPLILPGAVAIMVNKNKEVLLQLRKDGGWGLPGGLMELGESLEDTAKREVKEETGLEIEELKLLGIYSGSEYYFKIANGDRFYSVTAVYLAAIRGGELKADPNESEKLCFFDIEELPSGLTEEYKSYISSYLKN